MEEADFTPDNEEVIINRVIEASLTNIDTLIQSNPDIRFEIPENFTQTSNILQEMLI